MTKITDRRSILKQVISGICWSLVVAIGLFVAVLIGLMIYGLTITILGGGLLKVFIAVAKPFGMMAVILGYILVFIWSNQN